jgi:hypothetical protein
MSELYRGIARLGYASFLPFFFVFFFYIGFGYYQTFAITSPTLGFWGALAIALGMLILIYIFVRHTAIAIHHARSVSGRAKLSWIPLFLILFMFSGYGVITASMLLFEGPTVCRESISAMLDALAKLEAYEIHALRDDAYEDTQSRVEAERVQLHQEIYSPSSRQYCGIGPSAKTIIENLARNLPGIALINGTDNDHNCKDTAYLGRITRAYDQEIDAGLNNLAERHQIPQQRQLHDEFTKSMAENKAILSSLLQKLAGRSNFITNFSLYSASVKALEDARTSYVRLFAKLKAFDRSGRPDVPASPPLGPVERLASGFQVVSVIGNRLDRPQTWLYIAVALLGDLLVCWMASLVVQRYAQLRREPDDAEIRRAGVTYLWRPNETARS